MCSMAILHLRVKEVFYLIPMAKTCIPRLEGANHRVCCQCVEACWSSRYQRVG